LRRQVARVAGKQLALAPKLMLDGMQRALDPDPRKGLVTISGVVGPGAARARSSSGSPILVLDRRVGKSTTMMQLSSPKLVTSRKRRFTIGAHDARGTHMYVVVFDPASSSSFVQSSGSRKLR
jgi:hypothetical protein